MLAMWQFGTRTDAPRLYDYHGYLAEFHMKSVADYLQFGHDGYGINSYAVHYYLAYGALALALQLSWGGALTDPDEAARYIETVFDAATDLIALAEQQPAAGKRLLVAVSDHLGAGLSWLHGQGDSVVSESLPIEAEIGVLAQAHALLGAL